jgi:hypothetical protein
LCKNAIRDGIKVILPEYFDDCFRLGQICQDEHYLFPEPGIYKLDLAELLNVKTLSRSSSKPSIDPNPKFLDNQVIYADPLLISESQQVLPRLFKNVIFYGAKLTTVLMNATIVITDIRSVVFEQVILIYIGYQS